MERIDFINFIKNRNLTYRGRAMAFYEDGRDYGVVTVLSAKTSHHLVTSHTCFIYSEASKELIGTTCTGGHVNNKPFDVESAPCGRKYILKCDNIDNKPVYIGEFF